MRLRDNHREALEVAQQEASVASVSLRRALSFASDGDMADAAREINNALESLAAAQITTPILMDAMRRAKRKYGSGRPLGNCTQSSGIDVKVGV